MSVYARIPRNGKTAQELAEKVGKSARSARRWAAEPREVYLQRVAERQQRIRELRESGLTMRAIATELGISVSTVHYALKPKKSGEASGGLRH